MAACSLMAGLAAVRCPGNDGSPFHQDFAYGPAPYSSPEHSPTSDLAVVQILYCK